MRQIHRPTDAAQDAQREADAVSGWEQYLGDTHSDLYSWLPHVWYTTVIETTRELLKETTKNS